MRHNPLVYDVIKGSFPTYTQKKGVEHTDFYK